MKTLLGFALTLSIASAATLPTAKISGSYVEARNADVYTGACYANSEINLVGDLAVMGWKIDEGSIDGVSLKGLGVVGVIRATTTNQLTAAHKVKKPREQPRQQSWCRGPRAARRAARAWVPPPRPQARLRRKTSADDR